MMVQSMTAERLAAGVSVEDAVRDIDLAVNGSRFNALSDRERLVVTVHGVWQELDPDHVRPDVLTVFELMARDFAARGG
jgi:hypothetical protein